MKTLEEILKDAEKFRHEDGSYGIKACKESILESIKIHKDMNKQFNTTKYPTSLYQMLEVYVNNVNERPLYNDLMVVACWELINNK